MKFEQRFLHECGRFPTDRELLLIILEELHHMSQRSDALNAAASATIAEVELVLAAVTTLSTNVQTLTTELAAAVAANTGADPDLVAAAQSAIDKLSAETQKAADTLAAIQPATPAATPAPSTTTVDSTPVPTPVTPTT